MITPATHATPVTPPRFPESQRHQPPFPAPCPAYAHGFCIGGPRPKSASTIKEVGRATEAVARFHSLATFDQAQEPFGYEAVSILRSV